MFLWNNIFFSLGFDVKDHYKDFGGDAAAYVAPVRCAFFRENVSVVENFLPIMKKGRTLVSTLPVFDEYSCNIQYGLSFFRQYKNNFYFRVTICKVLKHIPVQTQKDCTLWVLWSSTIGAIVSRHSR